MAVGKKTAADIQADIDERFVRWAEVFENGTSDPTWEDGTNLNQIRNHIVFGYRELDAIEGRPAQLSMFDDGTESERRPIPPMVDPKYMANLDELIQKARASAAAVLRDENYEFVASVADTLTPDQKKRVCYDAVFNYPLNVERFIESQQYPRLRIWKNAEYWIKRYVGIRKRIEEELTKSRDT